ncbi:MAG: MarR family winged helix-turn-helix transcriptional regulator [Clostridiales bacterium]|nr:MarR family winged helix-turn-helix transcriptional regulator [Clostridiales bacterium]
MEPRGRCHMKMDEETVIRTSNSIQLLIFISQLHRRKMERLLEGTGLHRAQHRMLMTLSDGQFTSQIELANVLEVSAATVAVSLKKLEKGGYIQKSFQEHDSRVRFVELTEKGHRVVDESKKIFHDMDEKMLEGFDEKELDTLHTLLGKMYHNAKNIE